jgi:hypothetical protein
VNTTTWTARRPFRAPSGAVPRAGPAWVAGRDHLAGVRAAVGDSGFQDRLQRAVEAIDPIVYPDGSHHIVLTAADGLSAPTSIAVRGSTVYVPSGARHRPATAWPSSWV